ncbi:hypothetical protein RAS1_04130 [Phycisphaerae bacterium RAS1]|nr:hypothetical protein RAS1_04130 [Phycisphaerae bacterium RAS1]
MTQLSTGPSRPRPADAENDIYTALMAIAFLFTLSSTIYVAVRSLTLFGTILPPGGS